MRGIMKNQLSFLERKQLRIADNMKVVRTNNHEAQWDLYIANEYVKMRLEIQRQSIMCNKVDVQ